MSHTTREEGASRLLNRRTRVTVEVSAPMEVTSEDIENAFETQLLSLLKVKLRRHARTSSTKTRAGDSVLQRNLKTTRRNPGNSADPAGGGEDEQAPPGPGVACSLLSLSSALSPPSLFAVFSVCVCVCVYFLCAMCSRQSHFHLLPAYTYNTKKIPNHTTPHHTTPHHATPRHATPRHTRQQATLHRNHPSRIRAQSY